MDTPPPWGGFLSVFSWWFWKNPYFVYVLISARVGVWAINTYAFISNWFHCQTVCMRHPAHERPHKNRQWSDTPSFCVKSLYCLKSMEKKKCNFPYSGRKTETEGHGHLRSGAPGISINWLTYLEKQKKRFCHQCCKFLLLAFKGWNRYGWSQLRVLQLATPSLIKFGNTTSFSIVSIWTIVLR